MKRYSILLVSLLACACVFPAAASESNKRLLIEVDGVKYPAFHCFQEVKPTRIVNPVYPIKAKREGLGGSVLIGAVVNEKGRVWQTFTMKSNAPEVIEKSVISAVRQWRFPKKKEGKEAIRYVVIVPMRMKAN